MKGGSKMEDEMNEKDVQEIYAIYECKDGSEEILRKLGLPLDTAYIHIRLVLCP